MTKRTAAIAAVVAAMLASALLIGIEGDGQTFKSDEWGYAVRADNPIGEVLFEAPARKYLLTVPMVFYKTSFETAGLDDYFPIRVLGIVMLLVCAGLFFSLARHALGDLAAVPPTVLLLFFGAAWDVVVTPLRLPALIAVAAGLGMLLCLERRDRRGDIGAAGLLAVCLASHPTAFAFTLAAFVMVLLRPSAPGSRRPIWVVLAPVAAYALWWILIRDQGPDAGPQAVNLADVPKFMAESFAAVVAAITGIATLEPPGVLGVDQSLDNTVTWVVAIAVVAAICIAVRIRSKPLSPLFWALLAGLLALWAFTALAPRDVELRPAGSGRYLYPSAVLLLLLLAELARDTRLPRAVPWIATAILGFGLAYNISQLTRISDQVRVRSDEVRGYVSALELVEGRVDPLFLSQPMPSHSLAAGDYYGYSESFGTPALSATELPDSPPQTRQVADRVLIDALKPSLETHESPPDPLGPRPAIQGGEVVEGGPDPGCIRVPPVSIATQNINLPPGGAWFHSDRISDVSVRLGRFGAPARTLEAPEVGTGALLSIPADEAATPWRVQVFSPLPVRVCGIAADDTAAVPTP